jgi:phage-related protein
MSSATNNHVSVGSPWTSLSQTGIKRNDDMQGLLNVVFPIVDKYDTMSSSNVEMCDINNYDMVSVNKVSLQS